MDRECLVPIPETLGTTTPETQWNQQINIPMLKQEIENDIDEEYSPSSEYNMLSQYVNYYDSETHVLDEMKEELFGYDYPQADCSRNNKIFSENNGLVSVKDKQKVKNENTKESLDIKQKKEDNIYELTIKLETGDLEEMMDDAESTNIDYVSVTPQKAQCKLYSKNSSNLLQHNNEHKNIEINTSEDNEIKKVHQCQCCSKSKRQKCNAVSDVGFSLKRYSIIHVPQSHRDFGRNTENQLANHMIRRHDRLSDSTYYKGKVQCDHCHRTFTNSSYLMNHISIYHYDYGKVFRCWCGKKYRTPYQLEEHEGMHNYEKTKVQCDTCKRFYKNQLSLVKHKITIHNDYGRVYNCWCGKEFHTPSQLTQHIIQQHGSKDKSTNNDKVHCVKCNRFFKNRIGLLIHVMKSHHDYNNKVLKSSCGEEIHSNSDDKKQQPNSKIEEINNSKLQCGKCEKEFNTPAQLKGHAEQQHNDCEIEEINNGNLQCVKCKSFFRNRDSLQRHIIGTDHDYDNRVLVCWCGKQIHTPLADNKDRQHNSTSEETNNDKFQCVICNATLKNRPSLMVHMKRIHSDYGGKVFSCWCGKEFSAPYKLNFHKYMSHDNKSDRTLASKVQCGFCLNLYKSNYSLKRHCKRMHYDYLFE